MNGSTIINTATHGSRIVTGGDGMTAGDDVRGTWTMPQTVSWSS
ncbi:hypothetical protein [Nocardia gipuzkoensis]|nr:hypothetical protein [Nocardia gipuzkoensis]